MDEGSIPSVSTTYNKGVRLMTITETKEEVKPVQGKPWADCGVFKTYEEANMALGHMIANQPTFNFKIRRCGDGGSQFKIKKRINQALAKVNAKMEKKLADNKEQANNKKSKKKSKK